MSDHSERLYKQNEDQYLKIHENARRIAEIEANMRELRTDLIGATGTNGLRGEFRLYKTESEKREKQILDALDAMKHSLQWAIGAMLSAAGVVIAIVRLM